MYPKAYLFHNEELEGFDHLISSPVMLTFNARQINANQKAHKDIFEILALYGNRPLEPK